MSQPPNNNNQNPRLNPGAFSFVPGQIPRQNFQPQQQPPQQQPYGSQGGYAPPPQQQQGGYYNNSGYGQGGYPQQGGYGQGQYGSGYGQGYGGGQGGGYAPPQQSYTPPHMRQQQWQQQQQTPQSQPSSSGVPAPLPPRPAYDTNPNAPLPNRPAPTDRAPIERDAPTEAPAPAKTISLNIGGGAAKKDADPAPPPTASKTIKLNIGGSSSTPPASKPATPAPEQQQAKVAPSAPVPSAVKADTPASSAPATGANTPTSTAPAAAPSSKAKDFNFTADKSKTTADAVLSDTLALADQETLKDLYGDGDVVDTNVKAHVNVVFIGHVDAGKSTLGGQLLYLTDMVDKRTMEKYEREAKEAGRETWYLSWALDSTTQERAKGKTVEVGRAYFETSARRYTVLDAPGHKTYVPSMISGAAQADVAILVISARKGEFETGFEKGGQTREHIMLVKTAGVSKVVIVINKMDDPTVEWAEERFNEIKDKLTPFVRSAGFNPKTDVMWIPISAYTGVNVKDRAPKDKVPWLKGPSLLEQLDTIPLLDRKINGPVVMPISEKYKDLGTVVVGKLESGRIKKGDQLVMMPNKVNVEITAIYSESEEEIPHAFGGDNVRVRLRGIEDEDVSPGFVLSSIARPVHAVRRFEAQLAILDHKNIICAGYSAVMHVHTLAEEIQLTALLHYFDKKTGRKSKKPPQFAKRGQKIIAQVETVAPVCVERFADLPPLGRFTLRDEGKTVAIGKITKLLAGDEGLIAEGMSNINLGTTVVASAPAE